MLYIFEEIKFQKHVKFQTLTRTNFGNRDKIEQFSFQILLIKIRYDRIYIFQRMLTFCLRNIEQWFLKTHIKFRNIPVVR